MRVQPQLFWEGIPVPYVAMWSSEMGGFRIQSDKHAGGQPALFTVGARGVGHPIWGKMNEQRQRQTVDTRLCQVCNVPLKGHRSFGMDTPDYTLSSSFTRGRISPPSPVLREPPACAACTRYAIAHCPGNRQRCEAGILECFEVFDYTAIGTIVGRRLDGQPGTPHLEEVLGPSEACIGMLKCMLTCYSRLTFTELAREIAA